MPENLLLFITTYRVLIENYLQKKNKKKRKKKEKKKLVWEQFKGGLNTEIF